MDRIIKIVAVAAVMVVAAGSVAAQPTQRFPDVPPDHPAYEAIEWAAEAGVTLGYGDGTFRPEVPLHKTHAVLFMERFYDEILGVPESAEFTRGDMMLVLHAISGAATTETHTVRVLETVTHSRTAWGAFVGTDSDNLCWILVQYLVNSTQPIRTNINCDPDMRPGPTTTSTTAPRVTGSCTHHHAGNPTHTHRRYSDGTVSGHAHQARSDTKCGYLWQ